MQSKYIRREKAVKQLSGGYNNRSAMPKVLTIRDHQFRTTIQTCWNVKQGSIKKHELNPIWSHALKIKAVNVLTRFWFNKAKALFQELRVNRIVAHYLPYASYGAMGEYIFVFCDGGQNDLPTGFLQSLGSPASVVRKSYQPSKLVWVPTEPADRNWHPFADGHIFCSLNIASAEVIYRAYPPTDLQRRKYIQRANISGRIVIDVDVSFRGNPGVGACCRDYGTLEYAAFMQFSRCACLKCKRNLPASLSGVQSQTQNLVDSEDNNGHLILCDVQVSQSRAFAARHPFTGDEGGAR